MKSRRFLQVPEDIMVECNGLHQVKLRQHGISHDEQELLLLASTNLLQADQLME